MLLKSKWCSSFTDVLILLESSYSCQASKMAKQFVRKLANVSTGKTSRSQVGRYFHLIYTILLVPGPLPIPQPLRRAGEGYSPCTGPQAHWYHAQHSPARCVIWSACIPHWPVEEQYGTSPPLMNITV